MSSTENCFRRNPKSIMSQQPQPHDQDRIWCQGQDMEALFTQLEGATLNLWEECPNLDNSEGRYFYSMQLQDGPEDNGMSTVENDNENPTPLPSHINQADGDDKDGNPTPNNLPSHVNHTDDEDADDEQDDDDVDDGACSQVDIKVLKTEEETTMTPQDCSLETMSDEQFLKYGQELVAEREVLLSALEIVKSRYISLLSEHGKLAEQAESMGLGSLAKELGINKLSTEAEDVVKKYLK